MDIEKKLKVIRKNVNDPNPEANLSGIRDCFVMIETVFRSAIKENLDLFEKSERQRINKAIFEIGKGSKGIEDLNLGEIIGVFRKSDFVNAWQNISKRDLSVFKLINLDELNKIRNGIIHSNATISSDQVNLIYNNLQVILKAFTGIASENPKKRSIRLPFYLVTVATVLALVVILTLLSIKSKNSSTVATETQIIKPMAVPKYAITYKTPKIFPLSLINTMTSFDYLYWFNIRIDNNGDSPIHAKLIFSPRNPNFVIENDPYILQTVYPKSSISENIDPNIRFLSMDFENIIPLQVTWQIFDHINSLLEQGTSTIQIAPKQIFVWELDSSSGDAVPKDFILSSLVSWTTSETKLLEEHLASILAKNDGVVLDISGWVKQCCLYCLGDRSICINEEVKKFPPQNYMAIRYPSQVVKDAVADPLEFVLLLEALNRIQFSNSRFRSALFIIPAADGVKSQDIYYGWKELQQLDWKAIRVNGLNLSERTFVDCLQVSSDVVNTLFREQNMLERTLLDDGAYFVNSHSVIALDFRGAKDKFNIL